LWRVGWRLNRTTSPFFRCRSTVSPISNLKFFVNPFVENKSEYRVK
jgi:hypothetical protein